MDINWFPGHMTKALRMMEKNIPLVDAVIYVLDSRAVISCLNPKLDILCKNKPILYAINKVDLIEKNELNKILDLFKGRNVVALNSTKNTSIISKEISKICKDKIEKYALKGVKITIRAMVLGIPNSGKSTLINSLAGNVKAMAGNKPGVTKGKQWIKVNDYFEVLDTPGTLYPKLDNQITAKRLAFIGSIKDEIYDSYFLALELIKELNSLNPDFICSRYNIELNEPIIMLNNIAKRRGFIKKGGDVDEFKGANALIDDFRKGRLGKIALETSLND